MIVRFSKGLLVGILLLLLTHGSWGACVFQGEVCVDSGCKTFTQDGTSFQICKDCWKWEKRYVCSDGGTANYCQTYENDPRYKLISKTCVLDRYGLGCEIEERVYREAVFNGSCGDFIEETCVNTQEITFNEVQPPYTLTGVCTEKERKYYCVTSSTDYCQPYKNSGCSQLGVGTCTLNQNGLCKLTAYNFLCGQAPQGCQKTGEVCVDNSTKTVGDQNITACWVYQYQYDCPTGTTTNTCTPYENNPDCTLVSENCDGTSCDRTYRCLIEETTGCEKWEQRTICSGEDVCNPNSSLYNPDICNPQQVDMSQYFGSVAYLYALNEIRKDYACAGDLQTSTASSTTTTSYVCSDYFTACGTGTAYICQSSPNKTNLSTDGTIEYCIQQGNKWVCPYRNEPCIQANIYTCSDGGYCYVMETTSESQNTTNLTYPSTPEDVGCLDSSYCADTVAGSRNVSTPNYGGSCDIRVFSGMGYKCRRSGTDTGFTNCCSDGTGNAWGIGGDPCNEEEKTLAQKREQSMCHYVGTYCSKKIKGLGFSICLQKKEGWCCFNSKLARIIHEQARPQLGIGWGSAKSPNCRGFTLEELARIDWTAIDFSEFIGDIVANVNLDVNNYNLTPHDPNAPTGTLLNLTQDFYQNVGGGN